MARKITIAALLAFFCLCIGGFVLAKRDVLIAVASSSGAKARFESFSPSKTHVFYITFKIEHHSEIQRAYWKLLPFRHVEVEK
jgi:hypothetical protein